MPDILIVDDDLIIARLLEKMLEKDGYRCCVVDCADRARQALSEKPFDLLLSDIYIPGESGLELAEFTRQTYPQTAIVIISIVDDLQTVQSHLRSGVYGYIVKPFEFNQASITIQNALVRRDLEIEAEQMRHNLEALVQKRTAALKAALADLEKEQAKSAETACRLSDQMLLLNTMRDAIPSPIFYKDADGRYQGVNKAFENCLGIPKNDVIGKTVWDITPKERALIHFETEARVLQGMDHQEYEALVKFADGMLHNMLINKAAIKNSDGRVEGIVGVMVDITEQKARETALRRSEEKMRQILDNIGIGVAVLSPEMRLLEMNTKMRQWFPEAARGNEPFCYEVLNNPALKEACERCPTLKTLQDGRVHEATLTKMDGAEHRTLRIISSPIRDDRGQVAAVIELVEDITEKIVMERELMQTSKMASIGQLAAGVAHEINNPTGFVSSNLNTLYGYKEDLDGLMEAYRDLKETISNCADLSARPDLNDLVKKIETIEAQIDLDFIRQDMGNLIFDCQQGTDRIKKIVEDLKHFAHPGQDKVQDTDINKELETTLSVVRNELKYKAAVLQELGELPIIKANPQQLNQVFVNILVNAAQAIDQMGEIHIKTDTEDGFARIEISDTGCGIAPEHLGKIFEPFFTTKEVGKGTGLGMNIAYNIIKKHKGTIEVDSEVGRGTTFTIKLPLELPIAA